MINIERARSEQQLRGAAALMRAFSQWAIATFHAEDDLPPSVFEKLEDELKSLPGRFAPPDGTLLIATLDNRVVGCIGGGPLNRFRIEAARLWVEPDARGHNIGGLLIQRLIEHATSRGFQSVVLRSHQDMSAAHHLYRAAGFGEDDAHEIFSNLQTFEIAMDLPLDT